MVGDRATKDLHEVLRGPLLARFGRWAYGLDEAPADFLCRHCVYARRG